MGITVIPAAALANVPSQASPAATDTANSGDFAALLLQQVLEMAPTTGANPAASLGEAVGKALGTDEDKDEASDKVATDAGLFPFLAGSAVVPVPPGQARGDTKISASAAAIEAGVHPGVARGLTDGNPARDGRPDPLAFSASPGVAGGLKTSETANIAGSQAPHEVPAEFANVLATQVHANQGAKAEAPTPPGVATPVTSPAWGKDFGDSVVWMSRHNLQTAQLNLNPPQMGPVQITLNISGDQATAVFASPHAEVRQAIQDALPQLREMLAGSGINLGQANVGSQLQQQANPDPRPESGGGRFAGDNAILPGTDASAGTAPPLPVHRGRGLVDLFA